MNSPGHGALDTFDGGREAFFSFLLSFFLSRRDIWMFEILCTAGIFFDGIFFFFCFTVRDLTRNITYGIVTIVANWNAK